MQICISIVGLTVAMDWGGRVVDGMEVKPTIKPGGLVTVAYLKARLDEGEDHLGIFLPLILDVIPGLTNRNFSTPEVQEALAQSHSVEMPQEAVSTLLKRATRQGLLVRDAGRFSVKPGAKLPRSSVAAQ